MKIIKRIFTLSPIIIFSMLLGMMMYRNNWFPISEYRKARNLPLHPPAYNMFYTPYSIKTPVFADRKYYDENKNLEFENCHILQLPRHYNAPIKISLERPTKIYRLLSSSNDNSTFKTWKKLDSKVNVKGASCTHTMIVYKNFPTGTIELLSGGPKAYSPIIIKDTSNSLIINGSRRTDEIGVVNLNFYKLQNTD